MSQDHGRKMCCVRGCQQSRDRNPDCSFFSLPTDAVRLHEWLKIIHRPDLLLVPSTKLKNYYVCSSHFENYDKNNLYESFPLSDAVPCRYLPETSSTATTSSVDYDDVILNTSAAVTQNPPENPTVNKEKNNQPPKSALAEPVSLQDDLTKNMRKLLESQMRINKGKNSKNFLFYAMQMYLLNPQAYRFVRAALKLPSENVLKKMKIKLYPMPDKRVIDCLSSKLKSFPEKAKYCTVCVEMLYLNSSLFYDISNDILVGLQDVDGVKSEEMAGIAYVILLRSILVKWDQPVAYCFVSSVKSIEQIEAWLDSVISNLFAIGFEVMAFVTNQGSNFKKYARDIKGITPEQHYFMVENKKIYYIYEVPQLLKCIRNNLGTKDAFYYDKRISWNYIVSLYRLECKKKNKLIPKICNGHVVPTTSLKNPSVKYAAEIFSNSVAKAMLSYINMKKMPEEARDTAEFCLFMNNLFDVLNSSTYKNDSVYKCALGSDDCQMALLHEALNIFGNLEWTQAEGKKKAKRTRATVMLPSLQITLNSIISISRDLFRLGHKRILTERLNLDPLEDFVNTVRHMVSEKPDPTKPTPIQLCRMFSKLFLKSIFTTSPLSERPKALQKYFEDASQLEINPVNSIPSRSPIWLGPMLGSEIDYRIELPKERENALIYVASYIFYKCHQAHFNCHVLHKYVDALPDLAKTKVYDSYNRKSPFYGKLKLLHYPFIEYIQQLENAFVQNFKKGMCSNPGAQLFSTLRDISFDQPCRCFPKIYAVKLLIRLRIYITVKAYTKRFRRKMITISDFFSELRTQNSADAE